MSYIIFVNPALLATTGMDFGAVMVATCVAAAAGTLMMGLLANYPIALAPGMGLNAYFAFVVCGALGFPWQTALGGVFLSGLIFIVLSLFKIREQLIAIVPSSLKHAIAAGIGLFIAFIGLREGGIVTSSDATLVRLGDLASPAALLTVFGLVITAGLLARRVTGALLIGMALTGVAGWLAGLLHYTGIVATPPSVAPTFLQMDIAGAIGAGLVTVVFVFLFVDLFDSVGTLIAIGEQGGFMRAGRLPRAGRALLADAFATSLGAIAGTSTTTSYIESGSGIAAGGRTGLANVVTAALFLAAVFFSPLVEMLAKGIPAGDQFLHPVTAPALIIVGSMMCATSVHIKWQDPTEAVPAFLAIVGIPLSFSIADGLAFAFVSYAAIKIAAGRMREVPVALYVVAGLFIARYLLM